MSDDLHFWIAMIVFSLMGIGLVLSALEFRRMRIHGDDHGDR